MNSNSPEFRVRFATVEDAAVIAWHRARMFQDMGLVPDELFEPFRAKALDRLSKALASGEYFGWLVSSSAAPRKIIAGAGVIVCEVPPFPQRQKNREIKIAEARRGLIVNVFTEPEWRRRGIAKLLMEQIIVWSRGQNLDDLVLHASEHGRALYEQLGFTLTEEMRFDITSAVRPTSRWWAAVLGKEILLSFYLSDSDLHNKLLRIHGQVSKAL